MVKIRLLFVVILMCIWVVGCDERVEVHENEVENTVGELQEQQEPTSDLQQDEDLSIVWRPQELSLKLQKTENMRPTAAYFLGNSAIIVTYAATGDNRGGQILFYDLASDTEQIIYEGDYYIGDEYTMKYLATAKGFSLQNGTDLLLYDIATGAVEVQSLLDEFLYDYALLDNQLKNAVVERNRSIGVLDYSFGEMVSTPFSEASPHVYDWSSSGAEVAYLTDYYTLNLLKIADLSLVKFQPGEHFQPPKQLVDYLYLCFSGDDSHLVLSGFSENTTTTLQVLDKESGEEVAQYIGVEGGETFLLDSHENTLFIRDGEKLADSIFAYDYVSNIKVEMFTSLSGEYIISTKRVEIDGVPFLLILSSDADNQVLVKVVTL